MIPEIGFTTNATASKDETLRAENAELRARLEEAEEMLRAIRSGEVDALVVEGDSGPQLFTLQGVDAEQNRLRGAMLAQVREPVVATDQEDRIIFLNAAAEQCYGVRSDDVLGRKLSELYTRLWPTPEAEAAAWAALEQHGYWCGEKIHRTHDGRELPVEASITLLHDPDTGERVGLIIAVRDITERREVEAALRRNAALFSKIIEQAPGGVYVVDEQFRLAQVNAEAMPAFSSVQPLIGRDFDEVMEILWGPEIGPQCASIFRHTLATGERYVSPRFSELRHDIGVEQTFEWETQRITLPNGQHGVVCYFRDVTAQELAEASRRESVERLALAVKCSQVVLWQQDLELRYTWLQNPVPTFESANAIGKRDADLMERAEDAVMTEAVKREVIRSGVSVRKELPIQIQGADRHYDLLAEPLWDTAGLITGITCAAIDITARKRAEEEQAKSEKHLRYALEAASAGAWDWDIRSGDIVWSPENYRLYDLDPAQGPPRYVDWESRLHPEDRERANEHVRAVLEGREAEFRTEFRIVSRQGAVRWLLGLGRVDRNGDGQPLRLSGLNIDITDRKRAEAALQASEARFRAAVGAVSSLIWTNNSRGELEGEQPGWGLFTGQSQEDYQGYGWATAVHPEDAQPTIDAWKEAVAEKRTFDFEHRVRRHDGEWRVCDVRAVPVLDEAGAICEWVGVHTDITERKQIEQALRESEERLQRIFKQSPAGILQTDADGNMLLVNDRWCEMLGYNRADLLGRNVAEVIDASSLEVTLERVGQLMKGGPDFQIEKNYRRKDGTLVQVQSNVAGLRDAAGHYQGLLAVVLDLTERHRAEAALREREHFLQRVTQVTPGVISVFDLERECSIFVSRSVASILGYSPAEIAAMGSAVGTLMHPDDQPRFAEHVERVRALADEESADFEHRMRTKSGDWRWFQSRDAVFARDSAGKAVQLVSAALDVTTRKLAETALAERTALLNGVLEGTTDVIFVKDLNGRLLLANAAFAAAAGSTPEQLVGKAYEDWFPLDVAAAVRQQDEEVIAGGTPTQFEETLPVAGEARVFLTLKAPLHDGNSRVVGILGIGRDITERKRTEEALREHAEILSQISDTVGLIDNDERILFLNSAGEQLYRVKAADVVGRNLSALYRRRWLKPEDEAVANATLREHGEAVWELIHVTLDGRELHVQSSVSLMRDATGKITGIIAAIRDITEQKRAETALRESEERSAFVRRSSGVGLWYCNLPLDVLEWDDLVKAHFHLPPDATVTIQTFYDRIHPDDREHTRLAIERSIAESVNYNVDYRTVNPETGATRWVRAIGRTFYSSDGTPTRFDGITLDVSDQKRAEASLGESERRFREMANIAPAMIWVTNEQHERTFLSQSWLEFTGQSDEDGLGFGWLDAVHPEDRDIAKTAFFYAAANGEPFKFDYRLRTKDGNYRWTIDAGKPRFNENGEFAGFVGSVIDDHDRHEFQLALSEAHTRAESSNESKSAFLANMSHEIRTPMTAILGYVDLLTDSVPQDDSRHYLQTIKNNGYYLLEIINDILDLSKIEAGKLDIEYERFEPHRLIADVRSIMEIRAKESGLTLEVHYEGKLPRIIHSDAKRLKQILINLIGNAIKFTYEGKVQICVRFDAATQRLQFEIIDTGIGISPDQMERLFKPFSQGDASVSRNFGGTGLGLIISQRLAEMLDGSITVTSTKGLGSTFSVSIATGEIACLDLVDYASLHIETNTSSSTEQNALTTLACHVLVVDDRRDIRFLSRHILTAAGATVDECHDGLVAVEHVSACLKKGSVPDIILLDMQMPNLDGYATAQRLRSLGYTRPIVALTADAMQGDMVKCLEAGCNDYLSKPIDKAFLLRKVAELTKSDCFDNIKSGS